MKNAMIELSRDVPDDPKVASLVDSAKAKIAALPPGPAASVEKLAGGGTPQATPPAGPYVGVAGCPACHAGEYESWAKTDHARAYKTLVSERSHMDFDCVPCHTTGYKKA